MYATNDQAFEWPTVSDLMAFDTGKELHLTGVRYIATQSSVRAIVSKLSNN